MRSTASPAIVWAMRPILTAVLFVAAASMACNSNSGASGEAASPTPPSADGPPSAAAQSEARTIFQTRCSPCHGAEGKGDGATARGLNPQPRNFQDPAWQTKVSDTDIERIIELGGAAVGRSPLMPPNPDLTAKPEVIKALRAQIRGLRH